MSLWIPLLNDIAVGLFGSVLAAAFCGVWNSRRNRTLFWCCMAALLLVQGGIYSSVWDRTLLRQIYPLIVHLPLVFLLCFLSGKLQWSIISVLTAYLCCQLRRWLALLTVAPITDNPVLHDAVELIVTVPLLLLLLRFVAPAVRQMSDISLKQRYQFGTIPALYYGFDYITVVYTDLLSIGAPVVVEFMPTVCCTAYLLFLIHYSAEERKHRQLQHAQEILDIQLKQSVREIGALRESQELARRYRHDLRHHLQYVSACIENNRGEQAREYISGICREIEAQKVKRYCENEAANLILSAFDARAKEIGVKMDVQGTLPAFILPSDSDLCVLLSNALENALHACEAITAAGTVCTVDVQFYERADKLFLQVTNPCGEEICFENGIPVSQRAGHGLGVQSICAIVQKYGGVYSFLVRDGQFILRLSV